MAASDFSISVVTSSWGDYGRYLPAWAESIRCQTVLPRQTVIIDAGIADSDALYEALDILPDTICQKIQYSGMGAARNAAVALCDTDWVIHLDADDELLPWALADVEKHATDADVVSIGAIRDGQEQVFPDITGAQILNRRHGMFSCGAFRRSLWEQRQFHTRNQWIDSAFWVGLAHLGARFTSTGRPGFIYRQHADSVSHNLTQQDRSVAVRQWKRACRRWTLS